MLSSAVAGTIGQLFMLRLITGLGIGGILPSLNTIVAEYASSRRRDLAIGFMHAGYPVGALLCGSIATFLIAQFSWQAVFVAGGILSAILLYVVVAELPESLEFLLSRQPPNALDKVNRLLGKLGQSSLTELPAAAYDPREQLGIRYLLAKSMLASSLLLWCAFFLTLFTVFFLQSWTPQIFVEAGYSSDQGRIGGIALSFGGIAGGLALGFAAAWFSLAARVRAFMGLAAFAMIGFIAFDPGYELLLVGAFCMAFFVFGSLIGLYAAAPRIYPATVRVTGIAWGIAIGRIGAIAGPYVAGLMIGAGLTLLACFLVFAAVISLAMICMLFLRVPEPAAA
jgi:MFS family permease